EPSGGSSVLSRRHHLLDPGGGRLRGRAFFDRRGAGRGRPGDLGGRRGLGRLFPPGARLGAGAGRPDRAGRGDRRPHRRRRGRRRGDPGHRHHRRDVVRPGPAGGPGCPRSRDGRHAQPHPPGRRGPGEPPRLGTGRDQRSGPGPGRRGRPERRDPRRPLRPKDPHLEPRDLSLPARRTDRLRLRGQREDSHPSRRSSTHRPPRGEARPPRRPLHHQPGRRRPPPRADRTARVRGARDRSLRRRPRTLAHGRASGVPRRRDAGRSGVAYRHRGGPQRDLRLHRLRVGPFGARPHKRGHAQRPEGPPLPLVAAAVGGVERRDRRGVRASFRRL
ncbi:MAG: L-asparaginase, partial [uncultured Rubrobacteraceae bacterium]